MPRWLPFALIAAAVLAVVGYGLLRPAAAPSREPADVQQRLDAVPRTIGEWACGPDQTLSDRTVNVGRFQAYLNRVYTLPKTATAVSVMVLYGEPGDIGAHDPSVCYAGVGWTLDGIPVRARVGEADAGKFGGSELWSARFRKQNESLHVYWGWGADGEWRAADNPRFAFANHRRIFKVYAQRLLPPTATPADPDPDPLREFVPRFLSCVHDAVPPLPR